ncbi:lipopolysaccharide biosynthesis protein [Flavobacterium ajazii]|uniref:lipopolysaccharide biosynthesis protein n=1 Tax=Flavobacterium ajazii TaxID=2692318 RepID=UPI0013D612E1|nr:oligosaccharide flippase family protein [Flavobacterium ajazii]
MQKVFVFFIGNWIKIKNIFQFTSHDISTVEGKSKERYRRILLTGGSTVIVKIFSASINLITVPLTLSYLGAERYGLWMAISSILALMGFADLGLGNGLLNAVSKANGKESESDAQIAVSSTFFILTGIACLLFLVFIFIYPFISWESVFNVKSKIATEESGPTMFVLVVMLLINMPLGVIQRIQDGYQEGYRFQLWLIVGSLLSLFGLLLCIYFKSGLVWLVITFSGGQLIATLLNGMMLFTKKRSNLIPKLKYFDVIIGKQLMNAGFVFFLLGLFTLLGNTSDNLILAQILGAKSVAGYEIVKKVFLFSMFTQFIIQPLWPAFAEAMVSGDIEWAKKTLKKGLLLSISGAAVISLPLLIFGRQIISFWVGKEFMPSWSLLLGFYMYVLIANYGGVMSTFLNSGELLHKQILIVALASICSLFLKIYLSLNFGVSGIIWATVIGYGLFYIIPSYRLAFRYLKNIGYSSKKHI